MKYIFVFLDLVWQADVVFELRFRYLYHYRLVLSKFLG